MQLKNRGVAKVGLVWKQINAGVLGAALRPSMGPGQGKALVRAQGAKPPEAGEFSAFLALNLECSEKEICNKNDKEQKRLLDVHGIWYLSFRLSFMLSIAYNFFFLFKILLLYTYLFVLL
jgi:hypothetical protein